MHKTAIKLENLQKFRGGGQKMLEFQQLFAKERPKPRFTSKILVNFLISLVFKPNSPNFLPKSAGF
jgi:hypothetical protein